MQDLSWQWKHKLHVSASLGMQPDVSDGSGLSTQGCINWNFSTVDKSRFSLNSLYCSVRSVPGLSLHNPGFGSVGSLWQKGRSGWHSVQYLAASCCLLLICPLRPINKFASRVAPFRHLAAVFQDFLNFSTPLCCPNKSPSHGILSHLSWECEKARWQMKLG